MWRRSRNLFAHLLCALIVGGGLFPDAVLCVGADGHSAFEVRPEGCCHPVVHASPNDFAEIGDDCSTDCSDTKIVVDLLISKSSDSDLAVDIAMESSAWMRLSGGVRDVEPSTLWATEDRLPNSPRPPRQTNTTIQLC